MCSSNVPGSSWSSTVPWRFSTIKKNLRKKYAWCVRVVFFVGSVEMEGVVSVMYRAMECRLEEVFEKLDDIGWIEKLCMELRDRINGLTPSRLDLEESFKREFDVELIVQMLRHEAVDSEELKKILESVWVRLSMLCAPVHDDEISGLLLESRSGNCSIAKMLCAANRIIDDIERLQSSPESVAFAQGYASYYRGA